MRFYPIFRDFMNDRFSESTDTQMMACDVQETNDGYKVMMNIPGVKKEDIHLSLDDGYLTVSASQTSQDDSEDDDGYVFHERFQGTYQRSFYVGNDVAEDMIHAAYQDGVLSVTYPKTEKTTTTKKLIHIE